MRFTQNRFFHLFPFDFQLSTVNLFSLSLLHSFVASLLRLFYRNPVVLPITTPQTTSIPKLTTVKIPAATQLKSSRGTPAIDAKYTNTPVAAATNTQSTIPRRDAAPPSAFLPSIRASTTSSANPYRSHSRRAASFHFTCSAPVADENAIAPTPSIINNDP